MTRGKSRTSRFRRVGVTWTDDPKLRAVSDQAFRCYWALRCGPAMGPAIGLCRGGAGQLMDMLRWPLDRAEAALDELAGAGLIVRDTAAGLIHIPGAMAEAPPPNRNSAVAAISEVASMPDSPLRALVLAEMAEALGDKPDSDVAALLQSLLPQPQRNGCGTDTQPLRNGNATTTNNQGSGGSCQGAVVRGQGATVAPLAPTARTAPAAGADSPSVEPVKTQEARKPEPAPSEPATEIRWNVTEDTRQFAEDLVAPHGLTVAEWMRAGGHGTDFKPGHMTTLKAEFKNRPVDPAEALKRETAVRNREWREVRALFERDFVRSPDMEVSAWVAAHPEAERFHTALRGAAGEMLTTIRHAGVVS